jgi:hypothetical protein
MVHRYRVSEIKSASILTEDQLSEYGGKFVSFTHRPRSTSQKHYFFSFWYSFLLEAK